MKKKTVQCPLRLVPIDIGGRNVLQYYSALNPLITLQQF